VTADLALPDAPKEAIAAATCPFRPDRRAGQCRRPHLARRLRRRDGGDLEPHVLGQHARAVLPDGRGHRRHEGPNAPGSIVNILSMNAHCGTPDLAVYSATKGALLTLTKNAANAHLAARIRVNGINLGWTDTETERHLHAVTLGRGEGWLDAQAARSRWDG
jgi:NAD(P)-dependent dehydrogenase (short-subunit alcohol dehydrogenase family)